MSRDNTFFCARGKVKGSPELVGNISPGDHNHNPNPIAVRGKVEILCQREVGPAADAGGNVRAL